MGCRLGGVVIDWLEGLGSVALFTFRTAVADDPHGTAGNSYTGLLSDWRFEPARGGVDGTFIGIILAVQAYGQFRMLHMESRLGGVINLSLVRELGPVLAATMLAGRVGSAMAAELGTMRVTEQIDALASMGANPIHYLVVPRFLGCLLLIPALTIMADFMGIVGGAFYSVYLLGIDWHHYWTTRRSTSAFRHFRRRVQEFVLRGGHRPDQLLPRIPLRSRAEGVGRAATTAFVFSFVVILMLDVILSIGLETVYLIFWPDGPRLF